MNLNNFEFRTIKLQSYVFVLTAGSSRLESWVACENLFPRINSSRSNCFAFANILSLLLLREADLGNHLLIFETIFFLSDVIVKGTKVAPPLCLLLSQGISLNNSSL